MSLHLCPTPTVSPKLWTLGDAGVSIQPRHCNEGPIWETGLDNGGGYEGQGGIWEISVLSFQYFCEPKTDFLKVYSEKGLC